MTRPRKAALSGGKGELSSGPILLLTEVAGPLLSPQGRAQAPPEAEFTSTVFTDMDQIQRTRQTRIICSKEIYQLIRKKTPLGERRKARKLMSAHCVLTHRSYVTGINYYGP